MELDALAAFAPPITRRSSRTIRGDFTGWSEGGLEDFVFGF
jgi:hypothetical protein